jgi:rare lipoprotein A
VTTHTRAPRSRANIRAVGALTAGAAVLAAPALAPAAAVGQQPAPPPAATPQPKLRVVARHNVRVGRTAPVKGSISSGVRGRRVLVQVRGAGHGWSTVARTRTRGSGRFSARWQGREVGRFAMRVSAPGSGAPSRHVSGKLTVLRPVTASWYGPGLYGNHLACGGTLSAGTVGVANKTLPCGTKVTLRYHGRTATVPVVDRGPYGAGRTYDLTPGTKQKLGFGSTGVVWSSR